MVRKRVNFIVNIAPSISLLQSGILVHAGMHVLSYVFFLVCLRAAGDCTEGDLPELLLLKRPVGDASDGSSILGQHDRPVLAVEHEADDVLLGHLRQLLVENLLFCASQRQNNTHKKKTRTAKLCFSRSCFSL